MKKKHYKCNVWPLPGVYLPQKNEGNQDEYESID
jgi:hypothetical protein